MKRINLSTIILAIFVTFSATAQTSGKLVSTKTHIKFFSTTPAENIEANNNTAVGTINKETGEVVFSVPMQGFEFEKALMQKHFNSDNFLDTQKFPKAKIIGKITNLDKVNFVKDGTYDANVQGDMTIKGVTKPITEKGTVTVKGNTVEVHSKFNLTLADYGISFVKGKPSTNIAKSVEVTLHSELQAQ